MNRTRTTNNSSSTVKILVISFIIFGVSQLVVNSILTPLGTELQSLNSEKEYLLEENRQIEEEVAKTNSIKVIQNLSEKKLKLVQDKQQTVIYIEDASLMAEK